MLRRSIAAESLQVHRRQLASKVPSPCRPRALASTRTACGPMWTRCFSPCTRGDRVTAAASQTSSAGTVVKESSGSSIKQEWAITISSAGTGAVDASDDGHRLRLTLLDANGKELYNGSTDGAKPWTPPNIDNLTKSWSRSGVVSVEAPAGTTPAVLIVEKLGYQGKGALDYIATITVSSSKPGATFTAEFVAQRWLASQEVPGAAGFTQMVVFATTSLPQDVTPYLRDLRAAELAKIRCENNPAQVTAQRQGAENIYDYQTYNDLGKNKMPRPPLGGKEYPYPRRLATNRASEANGGNEVVKGSDGPWLPFDERFNFTKKTDFSGGRVSAAVPAIFSGLGHLTDVLLGGNLLQQLPAAIMNTTGGPLAWLSYMTSSYTSFEDVAEHYSYDALPSPLSPALSTPPEYGTASVSGAAGEVSAAAVDDPLEKDMNKWFLQRDRNRQGIFQQPRLQGDEPPEPSGAKVAVSTLLDMASEAIMGNLKAQMKKPRVLVQRPEAVCGQDEEFGRQMLAGFNPSVIAALKKLPAEYGSAITEEDVKDELGGASMKSLVAAAVAGEKPRLFWVDYWDPFTAFFTTPWDDDSKVLHAGRALLYLQQDPASGEDVALVPIAIELAAHPNTYKEPTPTTPPKSGTVFSRSKLLNSGQKNMWDLAKLVFRSLDVGVHQLISHWLRCHAAIEPFLIALKRCISTAHPVYKLMLPHFRYTMSINAAARGGLINADGVIEKTFAAGQFAMRLSSMVYKLAWRFESQALPVDLASRGMVDAAGKPFLDYPYAQDGLRIWGSMERYFNDYLELYYGKGDEADNRVAADLELKAWWQDVTTKAHPDIGKDTWGVKDPNKISTKAELVRVLVTIAWTASAHHAAVNFGQYDFTSYPLNAPSLIRKPMPRKPSDKEWKDLVRAEGAKYEKQLLRYINSPTTNLLVALTVNLLSTHSQDEHLLDETNTLLTDDKAQELNGRFIAEMKQVEADIIATHKKGSWTRCVPGTAGTTATYSTCLIPGSAAGLTMRGVPYSVSI